MKERPFLSDVEELPRRARKHIESGAVSENHFMAQGIHSDPIAQESLQHANEEQGHADQIAARMPRWSATSGRRTSPPAA